MTRTNDPDPVPMPPLGHPEPRTPPVIPRAPRWHPKPGAPGIEEDDEGHLRTNLPIK